MCVYVYVCVCLCVCVCVVMCSCCNFLLYDMLQWWGVCFFLWGGLFRGFDSFFGIWCFLRDSYNLGDFLIFLIWFFYFFRGFEFFIFWVFDFLGIFCFWVFLFYQFWIAFTHSFKILLTLGDRFLYIGV